MTQADPVAITDRHRAYWRRNVAITIALLVVWFMVTFVAGYYAEALNHYTFLGFPLGFYTFAQGAIIVYLAIVVVYIVAMNHLDQVHGVNERR